MCVQLEEQLEIHGPEIKPGKLWVCEWFTRPSCMFVLMYHYQHFTVLTFIAPEVWRFILQLNLSSFSYKYIYINATISTTHFSWINWRTVVRMHTCKLCLPHYFYSITLPPFQGKYIDNYKRDIDNWIYTFWRLLDILALFTMEYYTQIFKIY